MDKKEFRNGTNTVESVTTFDRFVYEVRLYPKEGESLIRFVLWFLTWGIGVYFYYYLKNPFAAIPNYVIMAGSYLEDVYFNKFSGDEPKEYLARSKFFNFILFGITIAILIMSALQLLEYVANQTIKSPCFYNVMFFLGTLLFVKPLVDFIFMCFFKDSQKVIYFNKNEDSSMNNVSYLTPEFKLLLEKAANVGALTESKDDKGTK